MSSGNYAHNADTVTNEFVQETCPEEYTALNKILMRETYLQNLKLTMIMT
jgi:hypothetical protein